jgi:hypothetical protein
MLMSFMIVEAACAFAWRTYLLFHNEIGENDSRRDALRWYIGSLYEAGERDFDVLQVAALVYLKNLKQLGEDRKARVAAHEALQERRRAA